MFITIILEVWRKGKSGREFSDHQYGKHTGVTLILVCDPFLSLLSQRHNRYRLPQFRRPSFSQPRWWKKQKRGKSGSNPARHETFSISAQLLWARDNSWCLHPRRCLGPGKFRNFSTLTHIHASNGRKQEPLFLTLLMGSYLLSFVRISVKMWKKDGK